MMDTANKHKHLYEHQPSAVVSVTSSRKRRSQVLTCSSLHRPLPLLLILATILCIILPSFHPTAASSLYRQQRNTGAAGSGACEDRMKQCAVIPPYLCYVQHNNAVCCETCQNYRLQNSEWCPFGDRKVLIEQEGHRFSCSSYVATYGPARCQFDAEFKRVCCDSCSGFRR